MEEKRLLIAGATGYLGQYIVKESKKQGYWVRALTRDPKKLTHLDEYIDDLFVGEILVQRPDMFGSQPEKLHADSRGRAVLAFHPSNLRLHHHDLSRLRNGEIEQDLGAERQRAPGLNEHSPHGQVLRRAVELVPRE